MSAGTVSAGVAAPARPRRTARVQEIVTAARRLLEEEGPDALTMRRLADELGIRAPSLYKHLSGKAAVEGALAEDGLAEMGLALHDAVGVGDGPDPVAALLDAYRRAALAAPNLYRLVTGSAFDRRGLPPGLEEWSGTPFFVAAGEPHLAQALWSFAHGMVVLELDERFLEGSDLDRTWRAGADAFGAARAAGPQGPASRAAGPQGPA